jgi:hypothetical protein
VKSRQGTTSVVVSVLICFGVWLWANRVLVPANTTAASSRHVPIGNNSDLYPRWLGTRELLLRHRDPYSAAVTRDIQEGFYGRALNVAHPADPADQAAFAYPVYVVFLLAPTVTFDFANVAAFSRWLFLFGIAATIPLWMGAIGLRTKGEWAICAIVLTLSSYPSMLEFYMQNLSALVAVLLALACFAAVHEWLALSGFLLALSTIKPQLSALFVIWLLVWVCGRWKERRRLAISFGMTLLALVLGGEMLLPGWIGKFLVAIRNYRDYNATPSGLRMFFPPVMAWALAVSLVGAVLGLGWQRRQTRADSKDFGWMLAWVAVVTVVLAPISFYNQILLIPALLVLLAQRELIWQAGRVPRALTKAVFACLGWQWILAAALGLASLIVPAQRLQAAADVPLYTALALPMITLFALAAIPGMVRLRMSRSVQAAINPGSRVV